MATTAVHVPICLIRRRDRTRFVGFLVVDVGRWRLLTDERRDWPLRSPSDGRADCWKASGGLDYWRSEERRRSPLATSHQPDGGGGKLLSSDIIWRSGGDRGQGNTIVWRRWRGRARTIHIKPVEIGNRSRSRTYYNTYACYLFIVIVVLY